MIQNRVTVAFQPSGGSASDAVPAANQQVFIDLTAGTMTQARTNAAGLLVTGTGNTAVPLDDSRSYSVLVVPTATGPAPAASAGTTLRLSGSRLLVTPRISIHITPTPVPALACRLSIAGTTTSVSTSPTGWIISNDQSGGAVTVSSATKLLRLSSSTAPTATLALGTTPVDRGATGRINITVPAGTVNLHVTDWRYELSHSNPNGNAVTGTIIRPASEATATVDQFWEGVMCASGTVTARFVTGVTVRASGATSVAATLTAMDPQTATLSVAVNARAWTTTLTQNPEGTFTRAIATFHDTGQHTWTAPGHSATGSTIASGPNRGCHFVASTTGVAFTSDPRINTNVVTLSSTFQSAQGSVRVLAPASVRGQILAPPLVTITGSTFTAPNWGAVATSLGLPATQAVQATLCIPAADLLAGTRSHEHLGTISHKQNCLRALRALEPAVFIEAFVQGPTGPALNFTNLLHDRLVKVSNAGPTHNEVDETATRTAGDLRFVSGSTIANVNITSTGTTLTTWNPTTNGPLT